MKSIAVSDRLYARTQTIADILFGFCPSAFRNDRWQSQVTPPFARKVTRFLEWLQNEVEYKRRIDPLQVVDKYEKLYDSFLRINTSDAVGRTAMSIVNQSYDIVDTLIQWDNLRR